MNENQPTSTQPPPHNLHENWVDPTIVITALVALVCAGAGWLIRKEIETWANSKKQDAQINHLQTTTDKIEKTLKSAGDEIREDYSKIIEGINTTRKEIQSLEVEIKIALATTQQSLSATKERIAALETRVTTIERQSKTQ